MTERCAFSEIVLFHGQPDEHVLYCANQRCTAVFTISEGKFQLTEGTLRCKEVSEKIDDIRKILKYFDNLNPEKRENLEMELRTLENEFNDYELPPESSPSSIHLEDGKIL